MKILQIIPQYVPAYRFGGPLQVAHSLGKELVGRGHEVVVCTTNVADETKNLNVPLDQPVGLDGVTVFYQSVPRFRRWGYSPGLRQRVVKLISDADFVLIHNHFQYAGWIGARMARKMVKPYILFPHGSLKWQSIRSSSGLAKLVYLFLLERKNFQCAEHVAFNAEEERSDSLFSGNGIVVTNGIDPQQFKALPRKGAFRLRHPEVANRLIFLFLGRIDVTQKALDILLEAFARHVQAGSTAMLILAGPSEGADYARMQKWVVELGLAKQVLFTGLVSGQEKLDLLRDADVFLMPSRYEGLSIALLEAMASGLPIILSDRCGLHQQIKVHKCGLVVQPNVDSVVSAMAAMEDPAARAIYGENARKLALEEHVWPEIAENLEKLMRSKLEVRFDSGVCDRWI